MGVPRPVTNSMGESTPFFLRMASHSSSAPRITSSKTTILSPLSVLGGHSQKPLPRLVTSSPRGQSAFLESGIRCNWWSITKARLPFSVVSSSIVSPSRSPCLSPVVKASSQLRRHIGSGPAFISSAACAGDRTFIGLRLPDTGRTILAGFLCMGFSSRAASSAFFRTDQVSVAVFGL